MLHSSAQHNLSNTWAKIGLNVQMLRVLSAAWSVCWALSEGGDCQIAPVPLTSVVWPPLSFLPAQGLTPHWQRSLCSQQYPGLDSVDLADHNVSLCHLVLLCCGEHSSQFAGVDGVVGSLLSFGPASVLGTTAATVLIKGKLWWSTVPPLCTEQHTCMHVLSRHTIVHYHALLPIVWFLH